MTTTMSMLGVHQLRELVRPLEPTASVYLGPRQDPADDAELEMLLRRRSIIRRLGEQGTGNATVDAVVGFLAKLPEYDSEYAVFATDDHVVLTHSLPGAVPADRVGYGVPPMVGPVLGWLQRHPAYVVVVADRAGAGVTAVPAGVRTGSHRVVYGPDDDIRRHFPGGGQQPRLQRRAEDSWQHNADAVAHAVYEDLDRVGADLLLVAGDPRAILLLTERLRQTARTCTIRHLRGHWSLEGPPPSDTPSAVADYATDRTSVLLSRLSDDLSRPGRAVSGISAVLPLLAEGSAHRLFVVDDPEDHRCAWFGPDLLCAAEPALPGLRGGRMIDVAIRAALLTRTDIRLLTPDEAADIQDGIAVVTRHS